LADKKITIIIPCYNQIEYLSECLDSVLEQTYRNWNVIVVDDCSTDGDPAEIINNKNDKRITLTRHKVNKGLSASRNTGFIKARSDFLLPLDADDLIEPSYLEKINMALNDKPGINCVFSDIKLFGARDKIWKYSIKNTKDMTLQQWIPGSGTLITQKLWNQVDGYCEEPEFRAGNEDWDFWLAAVKIGIYSGTLNNNLQNWKNF